MNKKEIIRKVLSDEKPINAESPESRLDEELSRPENQIDSDLIDELTLSALESKGIKPLKSDADQKLNEFKKLHAVQNKRKNTFHISKWCHGLAAACLMVICANAISVSAVDMNIFAFVAELTKGGAIIDFSGTSGEITLPVSESDPYGIIAECEKNGISAETPHYLPEGFILTDVEYNRSDEYECILFRYEKDLQFITFSVESCTENMNTGIPGDKHNISEIMVNGHTAVMSKEDNQMIVTFRSGDYIFNIFTQNVDYDECEKILQSIK